MCPAKSSSHFYAELASLGTAIDEITERITKIADSCEREKLDGQAHDLYQAERSLRSALRAISKATQG